MFAYSSSSSSLLIILYRFVDPSVGIQRFYLVIFFPKHVVAPRLPLLPSISPTTSLQHDYWSYTCFIYLCPSYQLFRFYELLEDLKTSVLIVYFLSSVIVFSYCFSEILKFWTKFYLFCVSIYLFCSIHLLEDHVPFYFILVSSLRSTSSANANTKFCPWNGILKSVFRFLHTWYVFHSYVVEKL